MTIIVCLLCSVIYFLIKLYSECYELQAKSIRYMINPENITDIGVLAIIALTVIYSVNLMLTASVDVQTNGE